MICPEGVLGGSGEFSMSRYDQLLTLIDLVKPKNIIEIGTWSGDNAIRMIQAACKHREDVTYIGYDLFELGNPEIDKEEFNVKPRFTGEDVKKKLMEACPGVIITLVMGNTRDTLKNPIRSDLVFIDGGHSVETIANDYRAVRNSSFIVFDDYYIPDAAGGICDTRLYGCNTLVGELDNCAILPEKDPVVGGGFVQMALVVNK